MTPQLHTSTALLGAREGAGKGARAAGRRLLLRADAPVQRLVGEQLGRHEGHGAAELRHAHVLRFVAPAEALAEAKVRHLDGVHVRAVRHQDVL